MPPSRFGDSFPTVGNGAGKPVRPPPSTSVCSSWSRDHRRGRGHPTSGADRLPGEGRWSRRSAAPRPPPAAGRVPPRAPRRRQRRRRLLRQGRAQTRHRPGNPDTDGDGLTDGEEARRATDPFGADSDEDGVSDGDEVAARSDPNSPDTDGDTIPDADEIEMGLRPDWPDSDSDGLDDDVEIERNTDPLDDATATGTGISTAPTRTRAPTTAASRSSPRASPAATRTPATAHGRTTRCGRRWSTSRVSSRRAACSPATSAIAFSAIAAR